MSETTFDFDEWLETGTVAQRTVILQNDRALPDRIANLQRQYRIAQDVLERQGGETSVTDQNNLAEIERALDEEYAKWEESKEVWVVRALSEDELKTLREKHPVPDMPEVADSDNLTDEEDAAIQEWAKECKAIREAADLDYLATAFVSLTTSKGTITSITPEQLAALARRPGRQKDITTLLTEAVAAVQEDVELPAPFSRATSKDDQN